MPSVNLNINIHRNRFSVEFRDTSKFFWSQWPKLSKQSKDVLGKEFDITKPTRSDMLNCLCFERQDEIGNSYKETQNRYKRPDVKTYIRDVFRTMPNIYDTAFLRKYVMAKSSWLFSQKVPWKTSVRVLIMYLHMFPKNVCNEPIFLFMTSSNPSQTWRWVVQTVLCISSCNYKLL